MTRKADRTVQPITLGRGGVPVDEFPQRWAEAVQRQLDAERAAAEASRPYEHDLETSTGDPRLVPGLSINGLLSIRTQTEANQGDPQVKIGRVLCGCIGHQSSVSDRVLAQIWASDRRHRQEVPMFYLALQRVGDLDQRPVVMNVQQELLTDQEMQMDCVGLPRVQLTPDL
ncbi:hypothetical protein [Nakamurella multipartita]|uniref:hypothetical protein n=1 Tax=Nakamurella multipartita TaxID=53461 RepID=UPI0010FE55EB|nr:hypothetical protein [Nakamurella multipartita]